MLKATERNLKGQVDCNINKKLATDVKLNEWTNLNNILKNIRHKQQFISL